MANFLLHYSINITIKYCNFLLWLKIEANVMYNIVVKYNVVFCGILPQTSQPCQ